MSYLGNLLALDDLLYDGGSALHLNDTARGHLIRQRFGVGCLLELVCREKAAIGDACTFVLNLEDATNFRLERLPDFVEEVCYSS